MATLLSFQHPVEGIFLKDALAKFDAKELYDYGSPNDFYCTPKILHNYHYITLQSLSRHSYAK